MISYRRKLKEDMCKRVHPMVMMRRMWLFIQRERRSPRRVPRVGPIQRVKGKMT
jgi:hypothetical protein